MHERLGDAFTIVTPGNNQLMIASAYTVENVSNRRKEFGKPYAAYGALEIFGPNVNTVNGESWRRHRKITTPPFNEHNHSAVWNESLRQAGGMLQQWLYVGEDGVKTTMTDNMVLTLHVLIATGFGLSHEFKEDLQIPPPGHSMTYRDALRLILANLATTIIIVSGKLPMWILPKNIAPIGAAIKEFKRYMVEMVEKEHYSVVSGSAEEDNYLMSILLRTSKETSKAEEKGSMVSSKEGGLNLEEIYGNLFMYTAAGHETTANTLSYAIALLAAHPECQEWLGEEIDHVLGSREDSEMLDYEEIFPQLKRCLALMVRLPFCLRNCPPQALASCKILAKIISFVQGNPTPKHHQSTRISQFQNGPRLPPPNPSY